jgi:hypothetical protein
MPPIFGSPKGNHDNVTNANAYFIVASRTEIDLGRLVGLYFAHFGGEAAHGIIGKVR